MEDSPNDMLKNVLGDKLIKVIDGKFYQTFPTLHILKCIYFESRLFDDNEKK